MPLSGKWGLVISYHKTRKRHVKVKRLNEAPKFGNKNIKQQQMPVCRLCSSSEVNDLDLGELLTNENITVHYFCLLLASGLYQNGRMSDKKAIKGFLKQDIIREAKRGSRLKCCYCRGKGATIGCCMTACKKVFHLPCGRSHGTLHHFFDTFGSFCELHRPQQRVSVSDRLSFRGTAKATCTICLSAVDARSSTETIRSPCCKNSWFHHSCMQKYAVSAGQYFFKCPVCSSKRTFQSEMLNFGIYIPVQDASWERQPNAYSELLVRHSSCDAPLCECPQGRNFDAEMGEFDLILCEFCGSFGTHVACHGLTLVDNFRLCPLCSGTDGSVMTRSSDNVSTCEGKQPESDIDVDVVNEGRILRSQTRSRLHHLAVSHVK